VPHDLTLISSGFLQNKFVVKGDHFFCSVNVLLYRLLDIELMLRLCEILLTKNLIETLLSNLH
jgi:hypothetical protein